MASHSYCPMASHSYCPNGNSKYANDNIYQLTRWPGQYLVPTLGSCHTYQGYPTSDYCGGAYCGQYALVASSINCDMSCGENPCPARSLLSLIIATRADDHAVKGCAE